MIGGLPAKESEILHAFKGLLNKGKISIRLYDMDCGPVKMIGDEDGFSKAMLSEVFKRIMVDSVGDNGEVFFSDS
jgi:hypothetical protein